MDRLASGVEGGPDDEVAAQVRVGRRDPAQRDGQIHRVDVQGSTVGLGVHADRFDPEAVGRPRDADRDLTSIGDEQPLDGTDRCHQCRQTPYSVAPWTTLLWAADSAMPSTVRLSAGWMMPSSQTRPVA